MEEGASGNWWNHRHFQHHAKPNIFNKDPDVNMLKVFVLGDTQPVEFGKRKIKYLPYNYQHEYFFLIGPPLLIPVYFYIQIMMTMITRRDWVDLAWATTYYIRYFTTYIPFYGFFGSILFVIFVRFIESHWFVWVTQMNHIPMTIDDEKHKDWLTMQIIIVKGKLLPLCGFSCGPMAVLGLEERESPSRLETATVGPQSASAEQLKLNYLGATARIMSQMETGDLKRSWKMEVTKMINEGKAVDVVYMDFSKAFDKVPYGTLIQKVKSHGFGGSVLGPLLFVAYINDLEENVAGLISKFADDTEIGEVADSEEDCQRMQQDIDQLETRAEKQQMEFNLGK
eukprot:g48383.t1